MGNRSSQALFFNRSLIPAVYRRGYFLFLLMAIGIYGFGPAAAVAGAETVVVPSVEWITVRSSVIATGLLDYVKSADSPSGRSIDEWTLTVSKVIKGSADKKIRFFILRPAGISTAQQIFDNTSEFTVFLNSSRGEDIDPGISGKLSPVSSDAPISIIDLEKSPYSLFRVSGQQIAGREQLDKILSETISAYEDYMHTFSPKIKRGYLEMKPESEAYRALYSGSAVYLIVPSFMAKEAKDSLN